MAAEENHAKSQLTENPMLAMNLLYFQNLLKNQNNSEFFGR